MIQLSMKVTPDAKIVRAGLENVLAEGPRVSRQRLRTTANRVVRRMQAYPPERPGQRYKRTGRLFSHWSITGFEDRYTIANDMPYSKYVVGGARGDGQAWMHVGRWELLRDVTEEEMAQMPEEVQKAMVLVGRRNKLNVEARS